MIIFWIAVKPPLFSGDEDGAIARYRQIYTEARAELESAPPGARWPDFTATLMRESGSGWRGTQCAADRTLR
jgi:hypothetical protein